MGGIRDYLKPLGYKDPAGTIPGLINPGDPLGTLTASSPEERQKFLAKIAELKDMGAVGVQGVKQLFERGALARLLGQGEGAPGASDALASIPDGTYGRYAGTQAGEPGVLRDQGTIPYEGRGPQERGGLPSLAGLIQPGGVGATLTGTPPAWPDAPLPQTQGDVPDPSAGAGGTQQFVGPFPERGYHSDAVVQRPREGSRMGLAPGQMPSAEGGMSDDTKRAILSAMAGLSQAGSEINNVQSLNAIMAGQPHRPAGRSAAADMLQKAGELSQARSDKEAAMEQATQVKEAAALKEAQNPLVVEYNKQNKTNLTSPQDVAAHQAGRVKEEQITASQAKRGDAVAAEQMSAEQTERFRQGDLSAMPKEMKDFVFAQRKEWKAGKVTKDMEDALSEAGKLDSLLAADNSTGSIAAVTAMVKIAGDTGRLSDDDINRFKRRMGLQGKKDWLHEIIYSDLNPSQKAEFRHVARRIRGHAVKTIMRSAKAHLQGINKLYPSLKEDEMISVFLGEERLNWMRAIDENKILMVDPSGESEPEMALESELQMWLKGGWEQG